MSITRSHGIGYWEILKPQVSVLGSEVKKLDRGILMTWSILYKAAALVGDYKLFESELHSWI